MIYREEIIDSICKKVGIRQREKKRRWFSKKELLHLDSSLSLLIEKSKRRIEEK